MKQDRLKRTLQKRRKRGGNGRSERGRTWNDAMRKLMLQSGGKVESNEMETHEGKREDRLQRTSVE